MDYSRDYYIAAMGSASNRSDAERQAFAALVSFFGQSVKSDLAVASVYSEVVKNGLVSVSENTNVNEIIVTAASLDNLAGAAIGSVWEDGRGTVYALAYIEKARTVLIYTELVRLNQRNIGDYAFDGNRLTSITIGSGVQFEGGNSSDAFDRNFLWTYRNSGSRAGIYTRPNVNSYYWTRRAN